MKFIEIDEKTLKETTKCDRDFICLSDIRQICLINNCVAGTVHFIKCEHDVNCNYQIPFGNLFVCSCPTRKEIYNKYNL